MRRPATTVLALVLALAAGSASAQAGYFTPYPQADRYGETSGAHYEYARVVRVDPVFDGRGGATSQRCYTREDYYAGDGYDYGRGGYAGGYGDPYRDPYGRDVYDRDQRDDNGRMVATVVGGVVGAVLGSKVGGGSGRYATSAIGTMVGGMAGREIYEASRRNRSGRTAQVTVCDPQAGGYAVGDRYGGVPAYDVTYEYAGRRYTTRTDYHPGDTIRVRVDVRPE